MSEGLGGSDATQLLPSAQTITNLAVAWPSVGKRGCAGREGYFNGNLYVVLIMCSDIPLR